MAALGPGFVYSLFAVAVFIVAVPLTLLSILLEPWSSTYPRALGSCLGGLLGFVVAAVIILKIDPATARTPILMVLGYAIVPVTTATAALFLLSRLRYGAALKYATGSWLVAHVLVFLPGIGTNPLLAGTRPPIFALIDHTPPLLGLSWYTGFLALSTAIGALAAGIGHWTFTRT